MPLLPGSPRPLSRSRVGERRRHCLSRDPLEVCESLVARSFLFVFRIDLLIDYQFFLTHVFLYP